MNQPTLIDVASTPAQPPPPTGERYPLQVEQWGEDGETLLSRGHHDPRTFREAAQQYCVDELDDTERAGWAGRETERVHREWWRHQPSHDMGAGTEWEGTRYYRAAGGPGPGAFPVTWMSLD